MIISASRRTDIPAFYADWIVQRVREGYCEVPNPVRPSQVSRISLRVADVDAIVFWTRNPRPLLPHLAELDARGFRYCYATSSFEQAKLNLDRHDSMSASLIRA